MSNFETLMPIRTKGDLPPIFFIHGEPLRMAQRMQPNRPIYGLSHVYYADFTQQPESIAALAGKYLSEIKQVQPEGPYHLCGFSAGAMIAFEIARQLRDAGEEVEGLTLIEPTFFQASNAALRALSDINRGDSKTGMFFWYLKRLPMSIYTRSKNLLRTLRGKTYMLLNIPLPEDLRWLGYLKSLGPAMRQYDYKPFDCDAIILYRRMDKKEFDECKPFFDHLFERGADLRVFENVSAHEEFMLDPALGQVIAIIER